jgi:hypothetical protein
MPRKDLDGSKLAADVANLLAADAQSPPEARPSLMDAMRSLVGFIDARAGVGWTDPMIAKVLTEAGYPIEAATLRSYRKRMRDEGLMRPLAARKTKAVAPAEDRLPHRRRREAATAVPAEPLPNSTVTLAVSDVPTASTTAEVSADAAPRAPPPAPGRTFRVNPTNLPPDRA